jgi:hypothetical protein
VLWLCELARNRLRSTIIQAVRLAYSPVSTRLLLALVGALLLVRLPSLVQPMGPDQGLYAYVGERIRHGELAYRDAWDQKPPGIHYVYAALRSASSRDLVVPAADAAAAALIAAMLWSVGSKLGGPVAGGLSAALFLLLSDPSMARLGGVRVRAQCETFIALAVTASLRLAIRGAQGSRGSQSSQSSQSSGGSGGSGGSRVAVLLAAGLLLGAAFALKYNAGLYVLVVLLALAITRDLTLRDVAVLASGALVIPLILLCVFWQGGALNDVYQATIVYNVRYSGETYASRWDMLAYLVRFPLRHAKVDPLWFVGGVGCIVLVVAAVRRRAAWLPIAWVAIACVSIAINGSRELPQYFLQAAPALALAAGLAATSALAPLPVLARWLVVLLVAYGTWRVGDDPFPKLARNVWQDTQYALGRIDRRTHLTRYGGARDTDKYSALDNMDIGAFLASKTAPDETVYVFGYSPGSYVYANRRSASRFFWSRPVILGFNREDPRYGVAGLRSDLDRNRPAYVVLQQHDWSPDVQDSGPFFLSQPQLADWLRAGYHPVEPFIEGFQAWERNVR